LRSQLSPLFCAANAFEAVKPKSKATDRPAKYIETIRLLLTVFSLVGAPGATEKTFAIEVDFKSSPFSQVKSTA